MPVFSARSQKNLSGCHESLILVCHHAIRLYDFAVTCGHRGEEEQHKAFLDGLSDKDYPDGKHNKKPSEAVDLVPCPIDWKYLPPFYFLGGVVMTVAHNLGVALRWGGDWDRDGDFKDNTLIDLGHFELVDP